MEIEDMNTSFLTKHFTSHAKKLQFKLFILEGMFDAWQSLRGEAPLKPL